MSELIYIHRGKKTPYADAAAGEEYAFADFVAGETRDFALRFLRTSDAGAVYQEYPNIKSLAVSISLIDRRPASGTIAYQFGAGASTAANTTGELQYNHNARALQDAINAVPALVSAHGLATTYEVPGGYTIYFASAAGAIAIQARLNRLAPLTVVRARAYEINDEWVHEIRLVQAPLESTSDWERVLPGSPTIEAVQDGGYDNSGQFPTPEIQRLNMPPEFLGTYQLRRPDNLARTVLLDRSDDPATVVRDAIRAIYGAEGGGIRVELFENYALITFAGDLNGENIPLLEVIVGEAPPGDATLALNLLRPAVYMALRGEERLAASFEVRAFIAALDADPEDPGKPEVLFRREIRIVRDQNFDALSGLLDPKWHRPPNPVDYTPTTPDQIQSGIAWWTGVKGNGVATVIACDHDMDTQDVASVTVLDNTTGEALGGYSWAVTNANIVTLTFGAPPLTNSLKVIIAGAIPVSQWEPHTHTTAQVVGLDAQLVDLFTAIGDLQDLYEAVGIPAAPTSTLGRVTFLRPLAEVLHYQGTVALFGDQGIDFAKLPRNAPLLLPAVHDADTEALPIPLPAPTGNAGKAYHNQTGGAVIVATGGGIRGASTVPANGFVGCDGVALFSARKDGTTNSYFPIAYERPLFILAVNDKMMPVNRTLEVLFGIQLQLANAPCTAQWKLIVEVGTIEGQTTPDPVGANLEQILWSTTPIIDQRLIVTDLLDSHFFGVRIKRTVTDILMDKIIYGVAAGANADAPESANFVLRARLGKFDTENSAARQRGWLFYQLVGSIVTDADGKQKTKPAQAVIS